MFTALLCRLGVIEMPLFHVQDSDRPGYVIAMNYSEAESKWREAVAKENDGEDMGSPNGIALVCDDSDLIVDQDWSA